MSLQYQVHKGAINDMSLDEAGEFVATCSDDGTHNVLLEFMQIMFPNCLFVLYSPRLIVWSRDSEIISSIIDT